MISGPGAGTDPPPLLRPLVPVYSETSSVGRDDPPRDVTGCSCAEPPRSLRVSWPALEVGDAPRTRGGGPLFGET